MEYRVGTKRKAENPLVAQVGYSNTSNPFNDTELNKEFEWKLRDKKLRSEGKDPQRQSNEQKLQMMEDLVKAKRRREERELFQQSLRLLKEREARLQGGLDDPLLDWDQFEFDQNKKRAAIRLRENRARPIDVLFAISQAEHDPNFQIALRECDPPAKLIKTLTLQEKETLFKELKVFLKYDQRNSSYWKALLLVCDNAIQVEKTHEQTMHKEIIAEIKSVLKGKAIADLDKLENSIRQKLETQGEALDVEYWDRLLHMLTVKKAKLQTKEFFENVCAALQNTTNKNPATEAPLAPTESQLIKSEQMLQREAEKKLGDGEETFNSDLPMQKEYPWAERFQPRKPNFFNRVIKGYDWNRFNQTHFTSEEPPPPTIRGYRFNIFYPDIMDPNFVPNYTLHPSDSPDDMILVFHASAPYEDIAFRVHNGDWDYSRKSGFRCSFENGVLRLWWNFKRYRYRR